VNYPTLGITAYLILNSFCSVAAATAKIIITAIQSKRNFIFIRKLFLRVAQVFLVMIYLRLHVESYRESPLLQQL